MNVRLYDGTVRCYDCMDSSSHESDTDEPCLYCEATPVAPMEITPRFDEASYITEYGDMVDVHRRTINGSTYVFHRVVWLDKAYITIYCGQKGKGRGHSWDIHTKTGELIRTRQHPYFL